MEEKKLIIVEDDGNKISYGVVEEVLRSETKEVEEAIIELETEIAEKNARLEELKAKVAFNKYVIAYADSLKVTEEIKEEVTEEVVE